MDEEVYEVEFKDGDWNMGIGYMLKVVGIIMCNL